MGEAQAMRAMPEEESLHLRVFYIISVQLHPEYEADRQREGKMASTCLGVMPCVQ